MSYFKETVVGYKKLTIVLDLFNQLNNSQKKLFLFIKIS